MRAPYNTVVEFWTGPLWFPPNMLKASVPGRWILQGRILIQQPLIFTKRSAWVTTDYPSGNAMAFPGAGPPYNLRKGTEDRIAVPALGIPPTPILLKETIVPRQGTPYVRYHVGPLL